MKKLLLLALAAPLAGCAQRAELANTVAQPASGPFTLRYKLADQNSSQYQLRIEGETTTGLSSPTGTTPPPSGTTPTPDRAIQAKFQTQMTIRQDASAALDPVAGSGTGITNTPSTGATTPGDLGGTSSMNEDRTPGNERPVDPTRPPDTASTGTAEGGDTTPSSAAAEDRFELRQQVQNWTAQVDLPQGQIPNRLNGSYQDGQIAVEAHGAHIDLPQRYQQQIQQTLSRPVIATVTSKGEILSVEWPVPEQAATTAPGMKTERSADGLRAMTGSTETLNLWFGVIRLPDQAVSVGQTWDAKDQFPVRAATTGPEFHMEREAKYTLTNVTQSADGAVAEIAVNETLKLFRGETSSTTGTASLDSGAATATDSTTGSTTTTSAEAKPDLLQTRMGKVYFHIDRGLIDRAEQQVSVTWDTALTSAAETGTSEGTKVASQGQLQGTVYLNRLGASSATTGVTPAPDTTATPGDHTVNAPAGPQPSATAPTNAVPEPSQPRGSARTITP